MAKNDSKQIKNWKLRQIRKYNKVTQEDLAVALGISRSAYQHLETKGILTDDVLIRLSRFFDLPMEDFISKETKEVPHTFKAPENKRVAHRILSEDEKKLLLCYDGLSTENKNKIIGYIEGLLSAQPKDLADQNRLLK